MQWRISPDRAAAGDLRHAAVLWLSEQHVQQLDDVALIIAELLANAVKQARGHVLLELSVTAGRVNICVTDDGPGFQRRVPRGLPSPEAEGSRGLFLVQALSRDFVVDRHSDHTTVCCCILLAEAAEPA